MESAISGFDWDEGNRAKCQKHGVSIPEIETLFAGELAVFPATDRSWHEERLKAIGKTRAGRYVFVVFTLRKRSEGVLIRPISARYMHRREVDHYEKEVAKAEKR